MQSNGSKTHDDYAVAIICAMSFEMSAVRYMLDREHPRLPMKDGDSNVYVLGDIAGHDAVLACLPSLQGKGAAAIVATNLARTFPSIKWRFLVGIGGGVPSGKNDLRLGDVVISMPEGTHGGVVQYDLGRRTDQSFSLKGFLCQPPALLRAAVETMRSDHLVHDNKVEIFVSELLRRGPRLSVYQRPSDDADILFRDDFPHVIDAPTCAQCDSSRAVERSRREFPGPMIHYGLIASGDQVLKSSDKRNEIARSLGNVLCFEMEAAGLMTEFPCVVIRGISDYADSHKNDKWHYYAAAAAAAATKELLSYFKSKYSSVTSAASPGTPRPESDNAGHTTTMTFEGRGIQHAGSGSITLRDLHIY